MFTARMILDEYFLCLLLSGHFSSCIIHRKRISAFENEAGSSFSWSNRDPLFLQQAHLENITFAHVSEDDLRLYSDQCFLNLFRLSQLLLEYLLSVQDTLATSLEVTNARISDTIYPTIRQKHHVCACGRSGALRLFRMHETVSLLVCVVHTLVGNTYQLDTRK